MLPPTPHRRSHTACVATAATPPSIRMHTLVPYSDRTELAERRRFSSETLQKVVLGYHSRPLRIREPLCETKEKQLAVRRA
eukprot:3425043-Alexandrium_andersonii.AAC.1